MKKRYIIYDYEYNEFISVNENGSSSVANLYNDNCGINFKTIFNIYKCNKRIKLTITKSAVLFENILWNYLIKNYNSIITFSDNVIIHQCRPHTYPFSLSIIETYTIREFIHDRPVDEMIRLVTNVIDIKDIPKPWLDIIEVQLLVKLK